MDCVGANRQSAKRPAFFFSGAERRGKEDDEPPRWRRPRRHDDDAVPVIDFVTSFKGSLLEKWHIVPLQLAYLNMELSDCRWLEGSMMRDGLRAFLDQRRAVHLLGRRDYQGFARAFANYLFSCDDTCKRLMRSEGKIEEMMHAFLSSIFRSRSSSSSSCSSPSSSSSAAAVVGHDGGKYYKDDNWAAAAAAATWRGSDAGGGAGTLRSCHRPRHRRPRRRRHGRHVGRDVHVDNRDPDNTGARHRGEIASSGRQRSTATVRKPRSRSDRARDGGNDLLGRDYDEDEDDAQVLEVARRSDPDPDPAAAAAAPDNASVGAADADVAASTRDANDECRGGASRAIELRRDDDDDAEQQQQDEGEEEGEEEEEEEKVGGGGVVEVVGMRWKEVFAKQFVRFCRSENAAELTKSFARFGSDIWRESDAALAEVMYCYGRVIADDGQFRPDPNRSVVELMDYDVIGWDGDRMSLRTVFLQINADEWYAVVIRGSRDKESRVSIAMAGRNTDLSGTVVKLTKWDVIDTSYMSHLSRSRRTLPPPPNPAAAQPPCTLALARNPAVAEPPCTLAPNNPAVAELPCTLAPNNPAAAEPPCTLAPNNPSSSGPPCRDNTYVRDNTFVVPSGVDEQYSLSKDEPFFSTDGRFETSISRVKALRYDNGNLSAVKVDRSKESEVAVIIHLAASLINLPRSTSDFDDCVIKHGMRLRSLRDAKEILCTQFMRVFRGSIWARLPSDLVMRIVDFLPHRRFLIRPAEGSPNFHPSAQRYT
ncbi:hypothetical protein CBR_g28011 [Chara braunii]|uniref:Uncharacterized protein n=1 Tax=Chara braunii TaxID=69332 RepID=A0A388L908_CHABU|nr:hypothetical protein CBR_g28011 [Chara braunii]|eukprot:GBG78787.1 hypothetical protein CBR_g28011 [Chara braunii]